MKRAALLSRKEIFSGRIIRVAVETVRLPNGRTVELDIVNHPGAVAVVPLKDDGSVVLVRQFRWAVGGFLFEVPAGKLDGGESPEACARREVEEEVGCRIGRLARLSSIVTAPGFCDEVIHLFLATKLTRCRRRLSEDEVLEVVEMPLLKAIGKISDGTIRDAKSIAALHLAQGVVGIG